MPVVVSVAFAQGGKAYYFDPVDLDLALGDNVLAETSRGIEFGAVVAGPITLDEAKIPEPLKPILRKTIEDDVITELENREQEKEAMAFCAERIRELGLPMRLLNTSYSFDRLHLTFFFGSEGRVDFRRLVRDLAAQFKTRIELLQVGVRDQAKMLGGFGPCGRSLCCSSWLSEFAPVSIKMAKEQGLSLNLDKLTGNCGRLKCCLRYEFELYKELRAMLPDVGGEVVLTDGVRAKVLAQDVIRSELLLQLPEGNDWIAVEEVAEPLIPRNGGARALAVMGGSEGPDCSRCPVAHEGAACGSPRGGPRSGPSEPKGLIKRD